jgi:hypothetical protein
MEMPAPVSGSTKEKKQPSRLTLQHNDMEGASDFAPGDEVEFHGKGHVKGNRAADEFGDGQADIEVHSLQHVKTKKKGRESKEDNAAKMPMDKLKGVIKAASEKEDGENE